MATAKPKIGATYGTAGEIASYTWNGVKISREEMEKRVRNHLMAGSPWARDLARHKNVLGWSDEQINQAKELGFKKERKTLFKGLPKDFAGLTQERQDLLDQLENAEPSQRGKIREQVDRIDSLLPRFGPEAHMQTKGERERRAQARQQYGPGPFVAPPKGGAPPAPPAAPPSAPPKKKFLGLTLNEPGAGGPVPPIGGPHRPSDPLALKGGTLGASRRVVAERTRERWQALSQLAGPQTPYRGFLNEVVEAGKAGLITTSLVFAPLEEWTTQGLGWRRLYEMWGLSDRPADFSAGGRIPRIAQPFMGLIPAKSLTPAAIASGLTVAAADPTNLPVLGGVKALLRGVSGGAGRAVLREVGRGAARPISQTVIGRASTRALARSAITHSSPDEFVQGAIQGLFGDAPLEVAQQTGRRPSIVAQDLVTLAGANEASAKRALLGRRALGTNPRAVEELARTRGLTLEQAQLEAVRAANAQADQPGLRRVLDSRGAIGRRRPDPEVDAKFVMTEDGEIFWLDATDSHGELWGIGPTTTGVIRRGKVQIDAGRATSNMRRTLAADWLAKKDELLEEWGYTTKDTGESGAITLDLLTGHVRTRKLREALRPNSNDVVLDAAGAAHMALGMTGKADWLAGMRTYLQELAEVPLDLPPQVWDKLYDASAKQYEAALVRAGRNKRVLRQLARYAAEGEDAKNWYPNYLRGLEEMVSDPNDAPILGGLIAYSAQAQGGKGAVEIGLTAYSRHKMGRTMDLGLGAENMRRFLADPFAPDIPGGIKMSNFMQALQRATADDLRKQAEALMRWEIHYTRPENAVVIDRHETRRGKFTAKQVSEATQEELKTKAFTSPSQTEYAFLAEQIRVQARAMSKANLEQLRAVKGDAATLGERLQALVLPSSWQAQGWTGWKRHVNEYLRRAGKSVFTEADFIQIINDNPGYRNRIALLNKVRSPVRGMETPAAIQATLDGPEPWAIIGTEPNPQMFTRKKDGKPHTTFDYHGTELDNPDHGMLRHLAEREYPAENVDFAWGKGIDADTGDVWEEPSFVLRGDAADAGNVLKLGKLFDQKEVLLPEGLVDVATGKVRRRLPGVTFEASPDGHTIVMGAGKPIPFSMKFAPHVPGDLHPAWVALNPKLAEKARQMLLGEFGQSGAIRPKISAKFNPQTGKFEFDGGTFQGQMPAWAQQMEQDFAEHRVKAAIRTGKIPQAGEAVLEAQADGTLKVAGKPTWKVLDEMAAEAGAAAKVFGVRTQEKNMVGNITSMVLGPLEKIATGSVDFLMSGGGKLRPRERFMVEGLAEYAGMLTSTHKAAQNFWQVLLHETGLPTYLEKNVPREAIGGTVGKIIRLPFRPLAAADAFFSEMNRAGLARSHALRKALREGGPDVAGRAAELALNPTDDLIKLIKGEVEERLFRKEGGYLLEAAYKMRDFPGGRVLFPFVRVSTNLMTYAAHRSPLGLLRLYGAKSAGEAADILGKVAIGSALGMSMVGLALQGHVTGSGPVELETRQQWEAAGWQAESVKIGGKWWSYRGFEPLASFLRFAAEFVEFQRSDEELADKAKKFSKAMATGILDNAFVGQAVELYDNLMNFEFEKVGANIVSGFIPTVMKEVTRGLDPIVRDADSFRERVQHNLPGLSKKLQPTTDPFGRPVEREGGFGGQFIPQQQTPQDDPLSNELVRLGVNLSRPGKTVTRKVRGVSTTFERDIETLQEMAGERGVEVRRLLTRLIQSGAYSRMNDDLKKAKLKSLIEQISARQSRRYRRREKERP